MRKLTQSTLLNIGSLATFVAFPLLYAAVTGGEAPFLWGGFILLALGALTPFAARKL